MTIEQLVQNYENNRAEYLKNEYNETLLRNEFLDPFFQLLGWDIRNIAGKPSNQREVILEEGLKEDATSNTKKPDYTFRLFSERKFFVEAKKPSVQVHQNDSNARQVRRYGFTAKLKISVLSNFEYLIIYDCSTPVERDDGFQKAKICSFHFTEYIEKFGEIQALLGKEAVYSGEFDKQWADIEERINLSSVDKLFLTQINEWRVLLGTEILKAEPAIDIEILNDAVQSYINRILFLRVCEDRNIEEYKTLLTIADGQQHQALLDKFREADATFNSGLFEQLLGDDMIGNVDSVFWQIIHQLYFPESPYSFSVFGADVLGQIYEIFLWEKLQIVEGKLLLEPKSENQDRDIVSTPTFIVSRIIEEVLHKRCSGISFEELLAIKLADIACGSGAFLLEAYQQLLDLAIDILSVENPTLLIPTGFGSSKLPFDLKRQILTQCIYGVDKDYNAVEATKFGLLLKLLENEQIRSLGDITPYLPDLSTSIQWGNSLIESSDLYELSQEQQSLINPFDFEELRFDIIVGNPPYMATEHIKKYLPLEKPIYSQKYSTAYKQFDKYFVFTQRSIELLKEEGIMGYIVPSKFMKVGAALKLREYLTTPNKHIYHLLSFGAIQIFPGKTTYTCLLFASKSSNEALLYEEVHQLENWMLKKPNPKYRNEFPVSEIENEVWGFFPSSLTKVFQEISDQSQPLSGIVGRSHIANGIQTSRNGLYIIVPERFDEIYAYFNVKGDEHKVEKALLRPYYKTPGKKAEKARFNTYNYLSPNAYVIFPYQRTEDGRVSVILEPELEANYPALYRYFKYFEGAIKTRNVSPPIEEHDWYKFGRSQHLDSWESEEKIVVGVLSTGNKYVVDKAKTIVSSGGTAGYCIVSLPDDCLYSIYYIQAILNAKYCEWFAGLFGEVFRGGYIARGTKVLEKLPIRAIDFDQPDEKAKHDAIASLQEQLLNVHSQAETSASQRERIPLQRQFDSRLSHMHRLLTELYGLGDDDSLIPSIQKIYAAN